MAWICETADNPCASVRVPPCGERQGVKHLLVQDCQGSTETGQLPQSALTSLGSRRGFAAQMVACGRRWRAVLDGSWTRLRSGRRRRGKPQACCLFEDLGSLDRLLARVRPSGCCVLAQAEGQASLPRQQFVGLFGPLADLKPSLRRDGHHGGHGGLLVLVEDLG